MNERKTSIDDFPRSGSAVYGFLFAEKEEKKKTLKQWKRLNKYFTIPLYRSGILPLFGGGKIFLLLFTKGRKTGKQRITPIEYRSKDDIIHVVSARGKPAHWFKNLVAHPEQAKIKVGFKKYAVNFEIIQTIEEKNALFKWYVTRFPKAAKMLFGWNSKKDIVEKADFTTFSELVEVVKFLPKQ
ncbi:MAG: nitroreductase family deazaflavin-dependent oxidoreductase [Candidatus Heimdallarchaeota archaeon]|nr:nitroreductase family deazaflavin-dependent oxidoreductase [Candidatus Heimdallarchaeota archaeon]MCK4877594.1 nitroreductase family deazaflavin-dependent oxidoreductase [Candidatus Heimdallarchaeota archaeon]